MSFLYFAFLFLMFILSKAQIRDKRPAVKLAQGLVVGFKSYVNPSKTLDVYLGIPYAAPPTGKFRFSSPQRHPGWNGTLDASHQPPSCLQLSVSSTNQSEDCLFLNLWTPEASTSYPLPVIVLFDGDNFASSNHHPVSGQNLAAEDTIVVTVNYRLNVFGFLCFETQEVRGNMGLLDQYLSLLWIRENIRYFGGDPERVTLFGHSAGAAGAALHMISPRTTGYFKRIILSDGSAFSPWHLTNDAKSASLEILDKLACSRRTYPNMLSCIRSRNSYEILKAYEEFLRSENKSSQLLPVVDTFLPENDQYLPETPQKAFETGKYMQIPILTGISKPSTSCLQNELSGFNFQGYANLKKHFEMVKLPEVMSRYELYTKNKEPIEETIKWRYLEPSDGDSKVLKDLIKTFDFETKIEAPHFKQLEYFLLSSYVQPIYVFYIKDVSVNSTTCASVDYHYIFERTLFDQPNERFSNYELRFALYIKQLWKNFIVFGNPTPTGRGNAWQRYNSPLENHIEFLGVESKPEENLARKRNIYFWNRLLPELANYSIENPNSVIIKEFQNSYVSESGYRHAMYILLALVVALLSLLLICILLIRKKSKERESQFHMSY